MVSSKEDKSEVTGLSVSFSNTDLSEEIIWTSSDETVAAVSDGTVSAINEGTAIITAFVNGKTASCEIKVYSEQKEGVKEVILDTTSISLLLGESQTIKASVLPVSAESTGFTWESDDPAVASVSSDGRVTAEGVGEAIITATVNGGYHAAACRVIVAQKQSETYTLSFTGGEGSSGLRPSAIKGSAGDIVILPENTYENAVLLFAGWSDGENIYEAGSPYRIPYHDVTFTAQ